MKQAFTSVTILSFIIIAAFGLFLMGTMHGSCIAETVNGALCPLSDPLTGIAFHLNAFKVFSNAVFSSTILLLTLLSAAAFLFLSGDAPSLVSPTFANLDDAETKVIPVSHKLSDWISLHEKRDPTLVV